MSGEKRRGPSEYFSGFVTGFFFASMLSVALTWLLP